MRMSRWWRAYDEAVDDPKLILLTDKQFRAWFNLCCVCSANHGALPSTAVVAVKLRVTADKARQIIAELAALDLVDVSENGDATMHNWPARQYKSDVSTTRVKRFRKRKRNVSETPPEYRRQNTEDREEDSGPNGPPTEPEPNARTELFNRGLLIVMRITRRNEEQSRSLIGRWLKLVGDDAVYVLSAIDDAEIKQVSDATAWITAALKTRNGGGNGKPTVQEAARNFLDKFGEMPTGDSGPARNGPIRLLSSR